ncbi:Transcriptional regulator ATRX homolog [Sergentomyia squamirostris]
MDDSSLRESVEKQIETIRESLREASDILDKSKSKFNAEEPDYSLEEHVEELLKTLTNLQGKIQKNFTRGTLSVRSSVSEWKTAKKESVESLEESDGEKPKIRLVALEKLQDPALLKTKGESRLPNRNTTIARQKNLQNKSHIVISDSSDDELLNAVSKNNRKSPKFQNSLKEVSKSAKPVSQPSKTAKSFITFVEKNYPTPEQIEHAESVQEANISEIRNNYGLVIEKLSEAEKKPIKLVIKNPNSSPRAEKPSEKTMNTTKLKKNKIRDSEDEFTDDPSEKSSTMPVVKPSEEKSDAENSDKEDKEKNSDQEFQEEEVTKENGKPEDKNSDSNNDSDSDIVVNRKKRKRGRSNSTKENSSSESDVKTTKNRKRRIKRPKNDDSTDEENGENGDKEKGDKSLKRKNIRKVIKDRDLEDDTKKAARLESERKKRIEERQKLYNSMYEEPSEVKELEKVVLDFDEESKEELLSINSDLVKKLKPHQGHGIKFMWDACFETLDRTVSGDGSGCILAHCMGLGKTLQVIALTHTLLSNSEATGVKRVLVICPLSTVLNWVGEFEKWLEDVGDGDDIDVYELSKFKQNNERGNVIKQWHTDGGVLVMGYDLFRNLSNEKNRNIKKKAREAIQMGLINPGPELVICDEGHLLKNEKTSISKAVNKIRTLRRIVLTGTPLQNNLKEYYCMVQFVKPNLLGKYNEYMNRFVNPITNGQYIDSTEHDIQVMKRRSHVLHKMLDGCVQRRDYGVLAPFLPPKHEYVVFIKLTELQIKLYKFYMENKSKCVDEGGSKRTSILFADFQNLQRIWTHPRVLRYNSDRYEEIQQKKRLFEDEDSEGSLKDFIDDDEDTSTPASSGSEDGADDKSSASGEKPYKRMTRNSRAVTGEVLPEIQPFEPEKIDNPTEWWVDMVPESDLDNLKVSSKLMLLFSILKECENIGDKLLVFSQSLFSLDVIEHFLSLVDENEQEKNANPNMAGFAGSWTLGLDYFRLDGSTNIEHRNVAIKSFNRVDNHRARLFLISTKAGGLGVNLVAANRVVIFDASWNPSHDVQSIFRVYRFGQVKPCYIYRFLAMGTMEEKIYERQVTKQAISKRVIDEQQIDRHYRENDLMLLYKYDLEPAEPRETPILPKDRLFADLLTKHEELIYKYHEHDSLLENKEEETLNEDERRAAWEEFENEKKRASMVGYNVMNTGMNMNMGMMNTGRSMIGGVTTNNYFGFRGDVFLRLLDLKARVDNPAFNEQQIKSYIPLLVQQMYSEVSQGDMTTYNELIRIQQKCVEPQMYQGYPGGPSSGSSMMNQAYYNQMQNSGMYSQSNHGGNSMISDNGVINID